MLISTTLITDEERTDVLAQLPWRADALRLAGTVFGGLRNQSIDLIDTAIGPNHVRAALVALYEAADLLLEATMELAESIACELYFQRTTPIDPLMGMDVSDADSRARFPWRLSRYAVENACTHAITAGDHLANTHIRLAWEINATTEAEARDCHFDPAEAEPRSWISASELESGLRKAGANALGVLRAFRVNKDFQLFMEASRKARNYRHAIIHRDRPTYRELPAFGRTTLWTQDTITVHFPPHPDDATPPISEYRETVAQALTAGVAYAQMLWGLAIEWLPTVRVRIRLLDDDKIEIQTGQGGLAQARPLRDPGAFLAGSDGPVTEQKG